MTLPKGYGSPYGRNRVNAWFLYKIIFVTWGLFSIMLSVYYYYYPEYYVHPSANDLIKRLMLATGLEPSNFWLISALIWFASASILALIDKLKK